MIDIEPNVAPKADLIPQQPAQKNDDLHSSEEQMIQMAFKMVDEGLGEFDKVLEVLQQSNGNEMKARMTLLEV